MLRFFKNFIKYFMDVVVVNLAVAFTLLLRCDFSFTTMAQYMPSFWKGVPLLGLSFIFIMWFLGGYKVLWHWAGTRDRVEFSLRVVISAIPYTIIHYMLIGGYPSGVYIASVAMMILFMLFLRMCYKLIYRYKEKASENAQLEKDKINVMIIGAGNAGNILRMDIRNSSKMTNYRVACFIDDNKVKIGSTLGNVRVVGDTGTIAENVGKYCIDLIIFAIPSCPKKKRTEILNICSNTGCEVKALPSVEQLVKGQASIKDIRSIQVEDLLGRDPIKLNLESVKGFIRGKTVMVTGGGGSIGSELCRQIASFGVKRLIIFDIYENNAYDIQNELKRKYPGLDLVTLIGSVRDIDRLDAVFGEYRPDVVYHAAAHKHVPLMEDSPNEAVKNNVFGTLNTARMADKYGVKKFIMISTDKAVNPTNVMGATKRICEMIIQSYARHSKTEFVAVRFGNVLGSNGSVIPLFRRQIENGGPVTVTHPDIIRYFMTIPEAVSLVLEAGVDAHGGEIFVLDMGQPVKILTLAENLIRLSGHVPYKDIDIKFTGLRPGEKLYEELLMKEEGLRATSNHLIFIGKPIDIDEEMLKKQLAELKTVMADDDADIRQYIHVIVPTYKMPAK